MTVYSIFFLNQCFYRFRINTNEGVYKICNQTIKQNRYETRISIKSTNRIIIRGVLYIMTSQNSLITYNTNDKT